MYKKKRKDKTPESERGAMPEKSCMRGIGCRDDSVGVWNGAELNLTDLREISNRSVSGSNWSE